MLAQAEAGELRTGEYNFFDRVFENAINKVCASVRRVLWLWLCLCGCWCTWLCLRTEFTVRILKFCENGRFPAQGVVHRNKK